tara:strand:+ start:4654 stop:4848 length:195 start_codon:yes stop_codon:yes gene_type:complete
VKPVSFSDAAALTTAQKTLTGSAALTSEGYAKTIRFSFSADKKQNPAELVAIRWRTQGVKIKIL